MISIDRKICRDILTLTNQYTDSLIFDPAIGGFAHWHMMHPSHVDLIPSVPLKEVPDSLKRLENNDLIESTTRAFNGGMIFHITPELLHYKAFWFDRFTKTYIAGFISGVMAAVAGGLILHFLTAYF